ncbi:amidase [Rhodobacterales bacterium HKCCE3408]|nr:amidase [Rhodobacterales bacterium HKCCE3408]
MSEDPCDLGLEEAAAALRAGRLTSAALVQAHLDRIAERDPQVGAFVHVAGDAALAAAQDADRRLADGEDLGPLHGIPFAVKDLIDVAGWPVRGGSALFRDRVATHTAPAVQRLVEGGAIPLGLVASYELGTVGPDEESLYRQPVNPWNPNRITGGSSSGSAAAVAAGMVRLALGTDTGGSVRSPASYCGVVGWKPTAGMVPTDGILPLSPSLDHVGLIARTAADARLAFPAMTGQGGEPPSLTGLTLAYGRSWAVDEAAHPGLLPLLDAAASSLSLTGAAITIVDLPDYAEIETAASDLLLAEAFASYGHAAETGVGPMARASILSGAEIGSGRTDAARARIDTLRAQIEAAIGPHGALILPTTLAPAPAFADFRPGVPVWTPMRTIPFNLTGQPALSVPMGFADGLPLGLQIVGRLGADPLILAIAAAFEAATDHGAISPAYA